MPRIVLISAFEKPERKRFAETRISAQPRPSTVATTSASAKTSTVMSAPCASSGRYSARSFEENTRRLLHAAAPAYFKPHWARILSVVPSAFILRSAALILSSIALSPFFTPMPTLPGSTGL